MNASLYLLRALEDSLSVTDLDEISMGMVYVIMTEKSHDEHGYVTWASQKDFDSY